MAEDTVQAESKFFKTIQLNSVDGTVTLLKNKSGSVAVRLNNKKTTVFALYQKSKIFEEGSVYYEEAVEKADQAAYQHDIERVLWAIHEWNLPEEAWVIPTGDSPPPITTSSVELLREDVFLEINGHVTLLWDQKPETDDERKN